MSGGGLVVGAAGTGVLSSGPVADGVRLPEVVSTGTDSTERGCRVSRCRRRRGAYGGGRAGVPVERRSVDERRRGSGTRRQRRAGAEPVGGDRGGESGAFVVVRRTVPHDGRSGAGHRRGGPVDRCDGAARGTDPRCRVWTGPARRLSAPGRAPCGGGGCRSGADRGGGGGSSGPEWLVGDLAELDLRPAVSTPTSM